MVCATKLWVNEQKCKPFEFCYHGYNVKPNKKLRKFRCLPRPQLRNKQKQLFSPATSFCFQSNNLRKPTNFDTFQNTKTKTAPCVINYIVELLEPVPGLMVLTLLLRYILKNSLDCGNCVLQFFKLVSDTPEQSNLLENLGSQIFDHFLCSAIKDCFGHGFVVGEKNTRRAREKPDLGGFQLSIALGVKVMFAV